MKKRVLTAILAAMVAVMMLAAPAFADEATPEQKTTVPFITKVVKGNKGVALNETFNFKFTAEGTDTVAADDHPAISDVNIAISKSDSETEVTKTENVTLPTFTKPGVYKYKVKETKLDGYDNYYGDKGQISFDESYYYMYVYVVENTDGTLSVKAVTAIHSTDDQKVTWGENEGMKFTNEFVKKANPGDNPDPDPSATTTDLTVKKTVDTKGQIDASEQEFSFTVTFSTTGTVVLPTDWTTGDIAGVPSDSSITVSHSGDTFTFTLKDGQQVEFKNIPAGVTYQVTEGAATDYTPSYTDSHTSSDGQTVEATKGGQASTELTTDSYLIYDKGNSGVMTNTYKDITVTGILTDNAPFILLIVFAIGAGAIYIRMRRRAYR